MLYMLAANFFFLWKVYACMIVETVIVHMLAGLCEDLLFHSFSVSPVVCKYASLCKYLVVAF